MLHFFLRSVERMSVCFANDSEPSLSKKRGHFRLRPEVENMCHRY